MNIKLFNFAKKDNSTAQPDPATAAEYNVVMKTPSSIQAPVVELALDTVPAWNYAYIPDLGRYYFITGTSYNRGVWELSLNVDVLASFKTDIGGTSMYVERASAEKTGYLVDKLYPATNASTASTYTLKSVNSFNDGVIVLNVANGSGNTGTTSYVMTIANFGKFVDSIMVDGDNQRSIWNSVFQSIDVALYQPMRYIDSAYWFPGGVAHYMKGNISTATPVTSMTLGNFIASGFEAWEVTDSLSKLTHSYSITQLPKHPQASVRGSYCNMRPFSEYTLNLGPFGALDLDTAAIANATTINITVYEDVNTGQGRAMIYTAGGNELANLTCQYGVPLRVFSASNMGTPGSIMKLGAGVAGVMSTTGWGAIAAGVATAIGGVEEMATGVTASSGGNGAIIDHMMAWTLEAKFYTIAPDDNANNGRPLCAVRTPANLTGYMKVQKGLVTSSAASQPELDSINAYCEGGFYYE